MSVSMTGIQLSLSWQPKTSVSFWVPQLLEDVREECGKYGTVEGIAVPRPPPTVGADEPSRVYIKFGTPNESSKVKEAFNGRQFDGNSISAAFASEDDFNQAAAGKWTGAAPQAPGAGFMASPMGVLSEPHGPLSSGG